MPRKRTIQPKIQPIIYVQPYERVKLMLTNINETYYQSLEDGDMCIHNPQKSAQYLIKHTNKQIVQKILSGQHQVSKKVHPFILQKKTISKKQLQAILNLKQDIKIQQIQLNPSSKIQKINNNIKQLQQTLQREKSHQKQISQSLSLQAKQFILKMRRQKQQFNQKLKTKKRSLDKVFVKNYTQDNLQILRDNLQKRINQKRKQIQQKININKNRRNQRIQNQFHNQIQHWEQIKRYQSEKSFNQPARFLPLIKLGKNYSSSKSLRSNLTIQNAQKTSIIKTNKIQQINNKMLKAKLKLQNLQNRYKSQESSRSRIQKLVIQKSQQLNQFMINGTNSSLKSQQSSLIISQKLPSLAKPSKQAYHQPLHSLLNSYQPTQSNLQINASLIQVIPHPIPSQLHLSWEEIVKKMKFHQVQKVKGLEQLVNIQKRLDKFDKQGIRIRQKRKQELIKQIDNQDQQQFNLDQPQQTLS